MKTDSASIIISPDLCPIKRIDLLCKNDNFEAIYNDYLSVLQEADYRIVNFEAPITSILSPIKKRGPNLYVDPKHIEHLKFANFNLLTLANNHIMDQGEIGLTETLKNLKNNGLDYVGIGLDIYNARNVFYVKINGINVAILNFAENEFSIASENSPGANPLDLIENFKSIQQAKIKADQIIVIIHGGHEEYNLPSPRMQKTYRFFIESGADAVINHHSHCFSGYEIFNTKPIFYGLGNFIFDKENTVNMPWNFGYSVKFILKKEENIDFEIFPYKQCNGNKVGLERLSKNEEINFTEEINRLNEIIIDNDILNVCWRELIMKRHHNYIDYIEPFGNIFARILRKFKLMPRFLSEDKKRIILNLIRCEAHRDLLIEILKK